MIFNSIDFLLFFPIVYFIYLYSNHRFQNFFLLISSYFFYGYWDYRYLSLLFISTVVDYVASIGIEDSKTELRKKLFLAFSIISNLGILGFFKYYNFFIESAVFVLKGFGLNPNPTFLSFALPLGISFYTFQTMSYTIDVYRGTLKPTRSFLDFALYVTFFPQLVAGPIERATNLLPQIINKRVVQFEEVQKGAFLILLGYFKKIYVADNLALLVDPIFKDPDSSGASVSFACLVFYFQIYGDFAGYSDIARGLSKLMGFELMRNFEHPTFAVNVMDFWRRWHISFMSWLRDYVYFSIGNKNDSEFKKNLNNLIVFFLSGLWHGATWTFVIWGTINGVIFVFYRGLSKIFPARREPYQNKIIDTIVMVLKIFITLVFIAIPLIYFRSVNMDNAWAHTKALFINWMGDSSHNYEPKLLDKFIKNIALLILIEIHQFKFKDEFSIFKLPVIVRAILYICLFYCVAILGNFSDAFIYFVF